MKLRNKKTGDIVEWDGVHISNDIVGEMFDSIAELNEEWEDYKPTEPLIKDEKVRKAVRAWAEVNRMAPTDAVNFMQHLVEFNGHYCSIVFNKRLKGLEDGCYTIAELCGSEE